LVLLILLLIFVVHTSASDCLEDRLRNAPLIRSQHKAPHYTNVF